MIESDSISDAWEATLDLFSEPKRLNRFDSMRGPCVEYEDLLIKISKPRHNEPISALYPSAFKTFVNSYADGFLGGEAARHSTVSQRLYSWQLRDTKKMQVADKTLDQIARAVDNLKEHPESRYNIVGFWDPQIDPDLPNPVSPLAAYFRIRSHALHSSLMVRSVDAWLGAFPMFVGFSMLHDHLARMTNNDQGSIAFFILSYHVYEMDLPVIQMMRSDL